MDGTLLADTETDAMSARTIAAVCGVLASGTPFVLVTGRPPRWIPPVVKYLPGVALAVCANGAVRYDAARDQVLSAATLTPARLGELASACERVLPDSWLAVERIGGAALDPAALPRVEQGHRPTWASDFVEESRRDLVAEPAVKMLIRHAELTSDQMLATLRAEVGDGLSLTFSDPGGMIEAAPAGVTKASGLAEVARELGIDAADVIAFGDMPNDVEMLRWAGHGVAMGNAHPDVLAAADERTAPNTEDGVALVLERWFASGS